MGEDHLFAQLHGGVRSQGIRSRGPDQDDLAGVRLSVRAIQSTGMPQGPVRQHDALRPTQAHDAARQERRYGQDGGGRLGHGARRGGHQASRRHGQVRSGVRGRDMAGAGHRSHPEGVDHPPIQHDGLVGHWLLRDERRPSHVLARDLWRAERGARVVLLGRLHVHHDLWLERHGHPSARCALSQHLARKRRQGR